MKIVDLLVAVELSMRMKHVMAAKEATSHQLAIAKEVFALIVLKGRQNALMINVKLMALKMRLLIGKLTGMKNMDMK